MQLDPLDILKRCLCAQSRPCNNTPPTRLASSNFIYIHFENLQEVQLYSAKKRAILKNKTERWLPLIYSYFDFFPLPTQFMKDVRVEIVEIV